MSLITTISNLRVRTKMLAGFGCVLTILAGVGAASVISLERIAAADELINHYTEALMRVEADQVGRTAEVLHTEVMAFLSTMAADQNADTGSGRKAA